MAKIDFSAKAEVLDNGLYDAYVNIRHTLNSRYYHYEISEKNPYKTEQEALEWEAQFLRVYPSEWKECERLYRAKISRATRLRQKLNYMLRKGECCFVTLTFTDDVLAKTSPESRHRYVVRWCGNFSAAIANLDFGAKNGREHYHAVVLAESVSHDSWKYGAMKSKRVKRTDSHCLEKLAHYTAKLVNHAIKETTKGCRTIYSGYFGIKMPKDHLSKWHWEDDDCRYRFLPEEKEEPAGWIDIPLDLQNELDNLFGA